MKPIRLHGLHSVQAALDHSPGQIQKAWVDGQRHDKRLQKAVDDLRGLGVAPEPCERGRLDKLADGPHHQGIVIEVLMPAERPEQALQAAVPHLAMPLFLVLDNVQDPHNLGACLRTGDAVGVDGVIVTKDNAAGITPTVCKVACGAAQTVPVYQVTNLARTLRWLKGQGLWVVGAAGEAGQTAFQADLNLPVALVLGAEGAGLRHLTRQHCDLLVRLPMLGQVHSLNVSVAAGVLLYEILRQRLAGRP